MKNNKKNKFSKIIKKFCLISCDIYFWHKYKKYYILTISE